MSLWKMAWRYLWGRAFVTVLTVTGIVLGAALIVTVLTLQRESETGFMSEGGQFDLVVGAKGSPLQLVLSSIYHLDIPTGNIPYARFETLTKDARVASAIPLGLGDNYHGYRIVVAQIPIYFHCWIAVTLKSTSFIWLRVSISRMILRRLSVRK